MSKKDESDFNLLLISSPLAVVKQTDGLKYIANVFPAFGIEDNLQSFLFQD